jgi:hypothetical protein
MGWIRTQKNEYVGVINVFFISCKKYSCQSKGQYLLIIKSNEDYMC